MDNENEASTDQSVESAERVARVRKQFKLDRTHSSDWRADAKENYDFVALRQWSQEDKSVLNEQNRPSLTFDYTGKVVNAISGAEINNRQQVRYAPREVSDTKINEVLTAASDWVRDQCQAEDEESDAFRDVAISGMGWTNTRMDYGDDPDGNVIIERKDPLLMWWDRSSKKRNIRDAKRIFYGDWMPKTEVERLWPDADIDSITGDDMWSETPEAHNADQAWLYKNDQSAEYDRHSGELFILQYQCVEREEFYRAEDPDSGKLVSFDSDRFSKVKEAYKNATGQDLKFVKQTRNVWYRGFYCGKLELEYSKSPCQAGFTFQCITGRRDRNTGTWMGIVSALKDPQRWGNKWLSQVLHIINSNAKGGAFIETNALTDPRKAEEQWASASPLIMLKEGGIRKIRDRVPAAFPAGLERLMEFAFNAGPMVSGINLEALGLANRDQPGILESQRKQAAYGMIADYFDAMRLYRKVQGKILLFFIDNYISDGRLMRVLGPDGNPQVVALSKQPDSVTYDVIVDDAPHSPDSKEKTWEMLTQLLPTMMKQGIPIPPDLLDFSPLPSTLVEKWKAYIQSSKQLPPEVQQQVQQMQEQLRQLSQQNQVLQQENGQLKMSGAIDMLKLQQKASAQEQNSAIKEKAITAESFNRQLETMTKAATDRMQMHVNGMISDMRNAIDAHKTLLDHGRQEAVKQEKAQDINITLQPSKKTTKIKKTPQGYEATTE